MTPIAGRELTSDSKRNSQFPAYGPIEAALGFLLFFVLLSRVTPVIVSVFSDIGLESTPSVIRFALAAVLWFVLLVTAVDQIRRQLAALGVTTYESHELRVWSRIHDSSLRTAGYLVALLSGGVLAAMTFSRAVDALESLLYLVATADPSGFDVVELVVLIVFVGSYGLVAHSLDRIVIGGLRGIGSD